MWSKGKTVSLIVAGLLIGCKAMPIYVSPQASEIERRPVNTSVPHVPATVTAAASSNVTLSTTEQNAILKEIESWMGTPYAFGKIEKGKGVDCSGFVVSVFKQALSMDLPRQTSELYSTGVQVQKSELKFGDLVFLEGTYKGSKGASHVGIFVGNDQMAHASTTAGVTISKLSEEYYVKHHLGCRRIIK
ncbi:MAG: C40 family peptidase [Bacteroidetes bacterium]|nr:C40 family peptidase [Bacteroidota bacterium]